MSGRMVPFGAVSSSRDLKLTNDRSPARSQHGEIDYGWFLGFALIPDPPRERETAAANWNDPTTPWNEAAFNAGFNDPETEWDESRRGAGEKHIPFFPPAPEEGAPMMEWVLYGAALLLMAGAAALLKKYGLPPFSGKTKVAAE